MDFTGCFCAFLKLFLFKKTKGIHSSGQFRSFNVLVKMKAVALLSKMTHTSFIQEIVKCIEALLRGKCFRYF